VRLASALNIGIEEIAELAPTLQEEETRRVEEFVRDLREQLKELKGRQREVFVAIGEVPEALMGEFERFARENPECTRRLGAVEALADTNGHKEEQESK
jgi:DNA-binding transcriptional MerR regulator